jgi:predicted dehydrogenase
MKKKSPVNVAVVGLGFMGLMHLRAYQKIHGARIVAVCDPTSTITDGRVVGVKGNLGAATDVQLPADVKCYRDYSELLTDAAIDLVDICTPTRLHPAQVAGAMRAHKHVLCEKPLAENLVDARKIIFEAGRNGNFLMPAMCMRFWPGWTELKKIVSKKIYGAVLAAHFRRVSARPAWGRNGVHAGGALYDLHIHDTDFVNFLFGRPEKVFSTGVTGPTGEIDHIVTQYFYPHGPAVSAEGSWLAADFNMSFTVHCERATLDFDLARGAAALQISQRGRTRRVQSAGADGYDAEIRYFVDCVARGRRPSLVTPEDSLTALEILRAEEKSVRTGQTVKL